MDQEQRSKYINTTCAPLFLNNYFLANGHNSLTTSATATFIQYEGMIYAVTCAHVNAAASSRDRCTAQLHAGRVVVNLSEWSSIGKVSALRDVIGTAPVDISICPIADHLFEIISRGKPKVPINLDEIPEANWDAVDFCLAAGFPDRAKTKNDESVASPMVEVIAQLASSLSPSTVTFTLQSTLEKPSTYKFSGMSGGPIFALFDETPPVPIGILFEGFPSSEEAGTSDASFLGDRDILIRGHVLTRCIFAGWLRDAGL